MDKVTQRNASSAEESASAAEEMKAQAEKMMELIGGLVAMVGGKEGVDQGGAVEKETHRVKLAALHEPKRVLLERSVAPKQRFNDANNFGTHEPSATESQDF